VSPSVTPSWGLLAPVLAAGGGALVLLALDALLGRAGPESRVGRRRDLLLMLGCTVALVASVASAMTVLAASAGGDGPAARPLEALSAISVVIVAIAGIGATWLSSTYLIVLRLPAGGYLVLVLLSLTGAFVAFSAEHLLVLYAGLELLALPVHVLAGWDRDRPRSNEAGLKSFLLGAFASAVLLYGLALLHGATGHLDFTGLRAALADRSVLASAGLALLLIGVALKAGLAPFHQWVPDVDEGSPASVTVFVSVCVRGAVLLVLLRLVVAAFPASDEALRSLFAALSVAGIAVGSLMAMVQRNVKRLIAWGGIAHAGTMLLAFVAGDAEGYGALLFYLVALAIATLGALGVVLSLAAGGREIERLEDFAGLGQARPGLSALLTLFVLGLSGLPVTAGFWAKLLLLRALVGAGEAGLAVLALGGGVILLYAYMRIPTMLYMREAPEQETTEASTSEWAILIACAVFTVYLGVLPDPVLPGVSTGLLELLRAATVSPS
jgi:NADH-quinone oxidoreductase subunit N